MKKGLGLLTPLFLMACSQQVTISKDTLKDKIAGGWAGKMIGVSYGLPTEFKALGKMYEDSIHWTPVRVKDALWEDDLYVQLTLMDVMDKHGMQAEQKKYQEALATAGFRLWHANVQTRKNYFDSIFPPQSGQPEFNLHADDIDFQIEADYIGFMCPCMPQTSNKLADYMGHIMNYGDGWYGGVYMGATYALAYVNNDIYTIVTEALKTIPEQSKFHRCITDVIKYWKQYPDDWRKCWLEIENRHAFEIGCPEGVFNAFNIDATINAAYCVMGLLYGNGDFFKTMDIATRCGQDSDCNPATAAGILGVIQGYKAIPEYWKPALERCENIKFPYTDISLSSVYDINLKLLSDVLKANGGKIKGDKYYTTIQKPKTVAWEVSFEGLYPSERRVIKYDLGTEKTFEFNGKGVVLMGMIRQDVKDSNDNYIAILEAYIDGKKVETIEMPYDYIKRKYDIFYNYDLEEGPHKLVIKWINPNEKYAVQCKDMVVYSSTPAEPINPYK